VIVVQGGVTSGLLNALVAQDLPGPGSVFLQPSEDPDIRAAFFLVNDLALILVRNPIAMAIGADR